MIALAGPPQETQYHSQINDGAFKESDRFHDREVNQGSASIRDTKAVSSHSRKRSFTEYYSQATSEFESQNPRSLNHPSDLRAHDNEYGVSSFFPPSESQLYRPDENVRPHRLSSKHTESAPVKHDGNTMDERLARQRSPGAKVLQKQVANGDISSTDWHCSESTEPYSHQEPPKRILEGRRYAWSGEEDPRPSESLAYLVNQLDREKENVLPSESESDLRRGANKKQVPPSDAPSTSGTARQGRPSKGAHESGPGKVTLAGSLPHNRSHIGALGLQLPLASSAEAGPSKLSPRARVQRLDASQLEQATDGAPVPPRNTQPVQSVEMSYLPDAYAAENVSTQDHSTSVATGPDQVHLRRIGGMLVTVFQCLYFVFGGMWKVLKHPQIQHEIVAVETDVSGKKRRAIAVEPTKEIPGRFPTPPVETVVQTSDQQRHALKAQATKAMNSTTKALPNKAKSDSISRKPIPVKVEGTASPAIASNQSPTHSENRAPADIVDESARALDPRAHSPANDQSVGGFDQPGPTAVSTASPKASLFSRQDSAAPDVAGYKGEQGGTRLFMSRNSMKQEFALKRPMKDFSPPVPLSKRHPDSLSRSLLRNTWSSSRSRFALPPGVRIPQHRETGSQDRDARVKELVDRAKHVQESPEQSELRASRRIQKQVRKDKARDRHDVRAQENLEAQLRKHFRTQEEDRIRAEDEALARHKVAQEDAQRLQAEKKYQARVAAEEAELARVHAESAARAEAEARRKRLSQPLLRELNAQEDEELRHALAGNNTNKIVCSSREGVELRRHDFIKLVPDDCHESGVSTWLNDEIVNAVFADIVARKLAQAGYVKSPAAAAPYAAYSSAWVATVQRGGVQGLRSWSRRKGIQGDKLLAAEAVFFPVNTGAHWTLLIVCPRARRIEYLDSLHFPGPAAKFFATARQWLAMELGVKYDPAEWTEVSGMSARQKNSDDCGVFCCVNGLAAAAGRPYGDVRPVEPGMDTARRMLAWVLVRGGFGGEWDL